MRRARGWTGAVGTGITAVLALACATGGSGGATTMQGPRAAGPKEAPPLSEPEIALYGALLAAADARRVDSGLIAQALSGHGPALRVEAARSAGQMHARSLAPILRSTLRDGDTAVAATAAFALGLMADTGSVAALGAVLGGPPTVAMEAAWSLGEIGAPARSTLEAALRSPSMADGPRAAVLKASAQLRPVPVALIVANAKLKSDGAADPTDSIVARAAAYALSRPPAPGGVPTLLALAPSKDVEIRLAVANGLTRRSAGDSLAGPARAALAALVADSDADVRAVAVRSISTFGDSARAQVQAALHDGDPNVRVAAGAVLDRVLGQQQRPAWTAAFDADTSLAFRRGVVAAAVRSGVVLEVIDRDNADRWQRLGDWRYRAAAAEAATDTRIDRVVDLALPLTRDPDGRVRAAAYGVFAPWLDSSDVARHPWRREFMRQALHDPDCIVRAAALGALASQATAADVEAAVDGVATARDDSQSDARVAAIGLLAAAWAHDSGRFSDAQRSAVMRLPVPTDDPLALSAAGSGSVWNAWTAARGHHSPPQPRAWYDSVVRAVVLPSLAGHPLLARIGTTRGSLDIALLGDDAPLTVANFLRLAGSGYYRGTTFHRVVPAFVAQDGDPRGDGNGSPPLLIRDELNRRRYRRGTVGMALSGPDTGGGQYFLTLTPQPHLDGHYTVFGVAIGGLSVLDRVVQGDSVRSVSIP